MTNAQYLDAISAPSSRKGLKKKSAHKRMEDPIEISDESDDEEEPRVSEKTDGEQETHNEERR
jgi:DNA-directed RNA polymerase III subunit RPC5